MSGAGRLMLGGMLLVLVAVAAYVGVDWERTLALHPESVKPLRRATRVALDLSWHWAWVLPVLLLVAAIYRVFALPSGRLAVVWKLFAYVTLWAIGSFAFFFGLFLAYAAGGEGGNALLVPAPSACTGYLLTGVGFLASVLRRP